MRNLFSAAILLILLLSPNLFAAPDPSLVAVQQWDIYEIKLNGPTTGNPFLDIQFSATFTNDTKTIEVPGFYDGTGIYRARFMPDQTGPWHYTTHANTPSLDKQTGALTVTPPTQNNHGPVHVANTYHFAYADGTPYYPVGTTTYNWLQAPTDWQNQTIQTLSTAPFNKLRFLVFPQNIDYKKNTVPPELNPFEGKPRKDWDYSRFNPAFFQNLEHRVGQLRDMNIEADVILFNPYCSQWGFDKMDPATDDRYLRYIVARLSAYRNVWWSMANEFDHLKTKTMADWDRYFQIVQKSDPYDHLRSVHNGYVLYDYTKPWVSHASLQNSAAPRHPNQSELQRDKWHKAVVFDELNYEGTETRRWGQLKPEEMLRRIWLADVNGTYAEHGECYLDPNDTWLSYGGVLRGESWKKLPFLRQILDSIPGNGIDPLPAIDPDTELGGQPGKFYLLYFDDKTPTSWPFELPGTGLTEGTKFHVDILDTWNTTITPVDEVFTLKSKDDKTFIDRDSKTVKLPGKPFIALRITPINP